MRTWVVAGAGVQRGEGGGTRLERVYTRLSTISSLRLSDAGSRDADGDLGRGPDGDLGRGPGGDPCEMATRCELTRGRYAPPPPSGKSSGAEDSAG